MGKTYRTIAGIFLLGIVALGAVWMYQRFQHPPLRSATWQNLPAGFSVVVYTPSFGRSWKALLYSRLHTHIEAPYVRALLGQGAAWDTFLQRLPQLRENLYSRGVLAAVYPEGTLYLVEAPFLAEVPDWREGMHQLAGAQDWKVELTEVEGFTLWRLPKGFLAPAGQLLLYAQQPQLITRFLRGNEVAQPPWPWGETFWAESPPWLSIGWSGPALQKALRHPALGFLDSLPWAELQLHLTEEGLIATGTWSPPGGIWPYLGPASFSVAELCPIATQALLSFRLQEPAAYYHHHLRPRQPKDTPKIQSTAENFFSKIAGEIGIAHVQHPLLLFRLRDPDSPLPKTPRVIKHRGYPIYQASVEPFLQLFLGEAFAGWEELYWLQLGEWLLLARTPQPLQAAIEAYIRRQTLYEKPEFIQKLPAAPKGVRVLGYFALENPEWLRPWLSPAQYQAWRSLLNPWQIGYFSLSPSDTASVRCTFQLYWRENAPVPQDTFSPLPSLPPIVQHDTSLEGLQEEYYPNGVLRKRMSYIGGVLEGEYTEYHPNGTLKVQGYYEQGQKVGKWRYFSSKGELLREESWSAEEEPLTSSGAEP